MTQIGIVAYQNFPSHWDVLPFDEAIQDKTGGNPKVKQGDYLIHGVLPVIDQGQALIAGFVDDLKLKCRESLPCILFGDHTKFFKYVDHPFTLGADGVKVLAPRDGFDMRFLFYYLQTIRLPDNTGYSRHFKFLRKSIVPKPPLGEQQRIAAILDKADAVRRKRQQAIQLADEFLRSVFLEMFGDPAKNPRGWRVVAMADLGTVVTGNTPPRDQMQFFGNYIEWIKTDNISAADYFLTPSAEGLSVEGKRIARVVPAGATLVTCIAGSPDSIGNSAYADREVAFNQQINAIVPSSEVAPFFLFGLLRASKKLIQSVSTASMKGMVSKSRFESIQMIKPPRELQDRYAGIFKTYLQCYGQQVLAMKDAENSFNALSQRAFRGDL